MTHATAQSPLSTSKAELTNARQHGPLVVAVPPEEADAIHLLRAAHDFSTATSREVLAVNVLEPLPVYLVPTSSGYVAPELESRRTREQESYLKRVVEQVAGDAKGWSSQVLYGDPGFAIAELSRARHASLLLMGIGRHRPIDRLLGTETALRAIRRAGCPVLAATADFAAPLREVVVATDFSPASARAAETVMPMLSAGAVVHLLHVWQPINSEDNHLRAIDEQYSTSLPDRFRRMHEILGEQEGIVIKDVVREGRAAERILDYAVARDADLIVAGRQGLNLLSRLFVGSVTTALLRGAACSLLVTPEPEFKDLDRFRRLLTGTSEAWAPSQWVQQLDAFTARNRGRRVTVEVDDLTLGAQVMESGYRLRSASYDPLTEKVELSLGDAENTARHITRGIGHVESVAVAADIHGRDVGLRITHAPGQTVLTFTEE